MSGESDFGAEVIGGSKLTELYGYWPSFHDAIVESILIERVGPAVTIALTVCDMACDGARVLENDRRARVVLRWHGVGGLELEGIDTEGNNRIDGLAIERRNDEIRCELLPMDGIHGRLIAEQVEVVTVERFDRQNNHN